ncbi:ras-related protein Rab-44 isoform X4 [Hirundo rustica]|uniref:ras-related protein Rab-44 isoform X4 n=1 Tax=Hirundo rustica TaxID=43150 RepID=UPI001A93F2B2|nr:ras-related protein Rab-44 isoform X4 [Hirundo rustica]
MPVVHLIPCPLTEQSACSPWAASGFAAGFKAKFVIQAGTLKKTSESSTVGTSSNSGAKGPSQGGFSDTPQPRTITNQDGMGTLLHSLQHLQCLCRAALGSGGSGSFPPPACSAANRKRAAPAVECHPRTESALSKRDESGARGSSGALGVGAVSPVTWGAPRVPQHRASLSARAEGAMSERRAAAKGRRLGSSRRKQLREGSGETPAAAPSPGEEPPWASEIVQRVQQLLADRDAEQAAVVTRSDVQKLHEEGLPCSREELELVFDGLDAAGTGRLGTEEFTAGLPGQFLSSQKAAREHRRRKTASRRVQLVLPVPLAGVDSEERRHFAAFMEQLGTGDPSEEQEIWQLWVKLRQDEPQLLDNLEDFLAKMRHRIQEARSEKEALELTLNKRVAEHDKDVQQLCEVLEQQIQQEQLRLQQQSTARSQQQGEELQRVLDASESEVQRLVTAQAELERRCRSLQSSQQVTSTENRQLEESNRALEHHLQHLHQQLQHTQRRLRTMRAAVVWEHTGEPGDRVVAELPIEVPMSPQLSPGKSEKFRSEMRIRLGSQSGESNAKSTHQVVWEMLPAETNLSGAPRKASSAEEDPFPEPLKEEGVSDQSSLLREMNDAIAALSKHLKAQALGAPPALADTPWHPWDNAEPQTGPEAATARETTPGVLQETLPGHVHRELLEGDQQEGRGTAELRAPDVTQADVWRLCAPGQAAQRELQEQVSAQGHEGRLHTVAQQPEGKMEPEHTAAEHPKREVPPASTLHTTAQPADAGSDQLGMVLRDNSLGKRQRLGEQSKDLGVGQREKMQEFGQKMSREGEPSPGEPGAVTAGGAGAAPRGCPKAPLDPDHVYNVLFVGDSHVGKTSFLYRLHADTFNPHLAATVGLDYQIKTLVVDNKSFALRLWDSAGQERYRSVTKQFFRKADGVVLMYDITSEYSFSDVRYWLGCIQDAAEDGIAVLLLGNKTDCAAQRQVPTKEGECLAKEHQLMFYECSAASGHNVFESMVSFVRLLKVREDELKNKAEEVPKAPEKKKGCCW